MSRGIISTGSCIAFSAAEPDTHDALGFWLLPWTTWSEAISLGNLGPTAALVTWKTMCDGLTHERPASKDYGALSIEAAYVETDPAQMLIQAAIDTTPVSALSCRVTLSSGSIRYFRAYPSSLEDQVGGADDIFKTMVLLNIDGSIVSVANPGSATIVASGAVDSTSPYVLRISTNEATGGVSPYEYRITIDFLHSNQSSRQVKIRGTSRASAPSNISDTAGLITQTGTGAIVCLPNTTIGGSVVADGSTQNVINGTMGSFEIVSNLADLYGDMNITLEVVGTNSNVSQVTL